LHSTLYDRVFDAHELGKSRFDHRSLSAMFSGRALDHDAIKWNRIMISSFCLSMIFSENRFPLFRIMP